MNKKERPTYKRFIAYIIDFAIVMMVASLFASNHLVNPYLSKYNDVYQEYQNYLKTMISEATDVANNETVENIVDNLTQEEDMEVIAKSNIDLDDDEYFDDLTYRMEKYSFYISLITVIVLFLYFVCFQYINHGKTVGKAIMGIRLKSLDGKIQFWQILVRSLINCNILLNVIKLLFLKFASQNVYLEASSIISYVNIGLLFISISMILMNKDNRGLHDLIAKTEVVYEKKKEEKEPEIIDKEF